MPIVGFGFDKITVERKGQSTDQEKIQNNIKINSLEESKIAIGKEEKEAIAVFFNYVVNYGSMGQLEMDGHILYYDTQENIKELINEWNKDKKVNKVFSANMYNYVLRKVTIKALELEEDVGLPLHMTPPRIELRTKEDKKD